ncbi:MAG: hypothetical protein MJ066_06375, partial [Clostridia bacterium]|nr:hypothetical protein [Clostridia bacterium]
IKFTGVFPGFIKTNILHRQKVETKNNKMVNLFMSPAPKIAKKIIKATIKHKKNLVTGYDGKVLTLFGKRFPNFTASAMKFIFKISKQDLFNDIF